MSSILLDKPVKTPVAEPEETTREVPKKLWSLHVVIPSDETSVFARGTLNTVPETGLFSERVKMTVWSSTSSPGNFGIETDVDGERFAHSVEMNVHMHGSSIRLDTMHCMGDLNADGTEYAGEWTMPCLKPGECDCEGLSGRF
jgi:hypothetical protein